MLAFIKKLKLMVTIKQWLLFVHFSVVIFLVLAFINKLILMVTIKQWLLFVHFFVVIFLALYWFISCLFFYLIAKADLEPQIGVKSETKTSLKFTQKICFTDEYGHILTASFRTLMKKNMKHVTGFLIINEFGFIQVLDFRGFQHIMSYSQGDILFFPELTSDVVFRFRTYRFVTEEDWKAILAKKKRGVIAVRDFSNVDSVVEYRSIPMHLHNKM